MLGTRQQPRFRPRDDTNRARMRERVDHHRERFGVPVLAVAEAAHGDVARGIAREMESTDATDGDDTAGSEQVSRLTDGDVAVA